jgi:voltage-gated potassium channel
MDLQQRVYMVIILLFILIAVGTAGYMYIEEMGLVDSLYMTVITISTVGFREVHELSTAGRLFTIILIISGLFIAAFAVTVVSTLVIEGEFRHILRRRQMEKILHS